MHKLVSDAKFVLEKKIFLGKDLFKENKSLRLNFNNQFKA